MKSLKNHQKWLKNKHKYLKKTRTPNEKHFLGDCPMNEHYYQVCFWFLKRLKCEKCTDDDDDESKVMTIVE